MTKTNRFTLIFLFLFIAGSAIAQDPLRFKDEVDKLQKLQPESYKDLVLFTGSSSIRKWNDVQSYFPGENIVNTGFGGSQWSDLTYYYKPLILQFKPSEIFIYEGDNDIADGKTPAQIMQDATNLIEKIHKDLPDTRIILISAKPSLLRWELSDKYVALNKLYKKFAGKKDFVEYIDVWSIMLDQEGKPKKDIFVEDGLHMNKEGYNLWASKIKLVI